MYQLSSFTSEWNGRYLDFDGNSGPQCVDVAKRWASLNGKPIITGDAIRWARASGYVWVPNSPTNHPNPGDLIVWDYYPHGHIGVCVSAGITSFQSFDQNFPIGYRCHVVNHSYSHVIGWLRVGDLPSGVKMATVNKDTANVRVAPHTDAQITSTLQRGDSFQYDRLVDNEEGRWIHSLKDHYVFAEGINY